MKCVTVYGLTTEVLLCLISYYIGLHVLNKKQKKRFIFFSFRM